MEEQKKRETVGAYAHELLQKDPETRDPIELQREIHKEDYERNVFEAIERGKKMYTAPFYIVVITKREKLMQNVLRHYFFPRQSCPRPEWDQVVYRYQNDSIEFLWTVPDKNTCELLKDNAIIVDPEERLLLQMVLDFSDGTLDRRALIYNGEIIT